MATKAAISRTAAQPAHAQRRVSIIQRGLLYALAIICAIGFTVPFLWTIGTSLKPLTDLYTYRPSFCQLRRAGKTTTTCLRWRHSPPSYGIR